MLGASFACAACRHLAAAADDVPAVLVEPTPATRAQLEDALASAFNGQSVTLAADTLTRQSLLVIEGPRTGRDLGRVTRFRLVRRDSQCVLVRESGDFERVLRGAACRPE